MIAIANCANRFFFFYFCCYCCCFIRRVFYYCTECAFILPLFSHHPVRQWFCTPPWLKEENSVLVSCEWRWTRTRKTNNGNDDNRATINTCHCHLASTINRLYIILELRTVYAMTTSMIIYVSWTHIMCMCVCVYFGVFALSVHCIKKSKQQQPTTIKFDNERYERQKPSKWTSRAQCTEIGYNTLTAPLYRSSECICRCCCCRCCYLDFIKILIGIRAFARSKA